MVLAKLAIYFFLMLNVANAATSGQLASQRGEVMQLGARLSSLERQLGQHNDKYIASIERIHLIETDVTAYQQRLSEIKTDALKRESELASILRAQALAKVEDEVVIDESYHALMAENRAKAQALSREAEALEKIVGEFQERLSLLRQDEQNLLKLRSDLENKKRQMTEVYLAKLEQRQKTENQLQKQKISSRISSIRKIEREQGDIPGHMKFAAPLEAWLEAVPSEKGVTYKFGQLQPIKAPKDGRVAYNGELASYGKVLMIDHGDDIRTVILGRFTSGLEKNTQVKMGDTLGHTESAADSLYFEVRKKNVAQKTIHWLEQRGTSKI